MNNRRMVLHVLGEVLLIEAFLMLLPCIVDIIYKENVLRYFLITIAILVLTGSALFFTPVKDKSIYHKDGFIIVAVSWIALSLFGCLPFYLSREIPSFIDALFETVSGFTTTGSSILSDVEILSHASLFWRSFTHWIGGMGVIVFITALIPVAQGGGSLNLIRAESPGVEVEKLVPKSRQTARILYLIYIFMTLVLLGLLSLDSMPFFDAVCITFGTAGTGGFGVLNSSVGAYSTYTQIVVTVFMVLFGINFNIYFLIICKRVKEALKSSELRAYLILFIAATLIVTFDVYAYNLYPSVKEALQQSAFQVASIMSTTGFATTNFDTWPEVSRVLLLVLMCVGSCAGSTAGGFKVSRTIIMIKSAGMEIRRALNPRRVSVVRYDGKRIKEDVVKITNAYFAIYIFIIVISVLIVSIDRMDFTSNFSGVIATLNNIGPGLNAVGPASNFSAYSSLSKIVFIFNMLLGRLEIFPILIISTSIFHIRRKRK